MQDVICVIIKKSKQHCNIQGEQMNHTFLGAGCVSNQLTTSGKRFKFDDQFSLDFVTSIKVSPDESNQSSR